MTTVQIVNATANVLFVCLCGTSLLNCCGVHVVVTVLAQELFSWGTRQLLQDSCCMPVPVSIVIALLVEAEVVVVGSASSVSAVVTEAILNVDSASVVPVVVYVTLTEPITDGHELIFVLSLASNCCGRKHSRVYHERR